MYRSLEAEWHDEFWNAEGPAAELPLLETFFRELPGTALEVGCGSGRLLLPLLERGFDVEGLELSGEMLTICRGRAAATGLAPILHQADMTVFAPGKTYAAIAVPAFTLQLAADPAAALKNFHALLEAGGGLYLTLFRPEAELANELPQNEWYLDHELKLASGDTARVETRHTLERKQRLLHREHRYSRVTPDGCIAASHESRQTIRWFGDFEIVKLLEKTGFTITNAFAEFDPSCPAEDAQILTIIARR